MSEIVTKASPKSVDETMAALEGAVTNAGATVFGKVDHASGAASVDLELADSQLLIFGNPKLGTLAMQADPQAGLYVPLRVLVYQDGDGNTQVAYESAGTMFDGTGVPADAEVVGMIGGALDKLSGAAIAD